MARTTKFPTGFSGLWSGDAVNAIVEKMIDESVAAGGGGGDGAMGPMGPQGPIGPTGPQGDPGPSSPIDNSLVVTGDNPSISFQHPSGSIGWVWDGASGQLDLCSFDQAGNPNFTDAVARWSTTGVTLASPLYVSVDPTDALQVATKQYVDSNAGSGGGGMGPTGPQGDPGPTGPTGDVGPIGRKGDPGDVGPAGADGAPGPAGDIGPTGPAGADGTAAAQGDPGPTGPAGADGAPGAQGDTGPTGPQGSIGPQGDIGQQGDVGPKGDTGPAGDPGLTGDPGPRGDVGPTGPMPVRRVMQVIAPSDTGILPTNTFDFPYQNIDNVEVTAMFQQSNGVWGVLPNTNTIPGYDPAIWWSGDGQVITIHGDFATNYVAAVRLLCYE